MFDQDSAQPERSAGGTEIGAEANPQTVTGGEDHETGAAGGLPWYFANRFEYRNNKSGVGRHLAPQDSYVQDVVNEGMNQTLLFAPEEGSTEFELAHTEAKLLRELVEVRNEFDIDDDEAAPVKMEAKAVLRDLRTRFILALKIAGANHVDRMYRIRHAQLNDWDINRTTEHNSFITSGNIRDKWARKAGYLASIMTLLEDLYTAAKIEPNLEGGIRQQLYQDARDVNNQLSSPKEMVAKGEDIDRDKLSALAA